MRNFKNPVLNSLLMEEEILQGFGSVRLVGGESLVSQRTVFSKDSKVLFCCCGRRIRVYSTATGDLIRELEGHESAVTDFKVNPKNQLQLVSCARSEVIYWDYTDGRILKKHRVEGSIGGMLLHSALKESIILIMQSFGKGAEPKEKESDVQGGTVNEKINSNEKAIVHENGVGIFNPKEKQELRIFFKQSGNAKQTAINGEGNLLASVKGENLQLWNFASEKLKTFRYKHASFTCASFHPSEACVAAGESKGKIVLWQGLDQLDNPITMVIHWHAHPVGDVAFSNDGSTIFSVGEEGVLVQWQYRTHHQQFLPRLGTSILHIAISPDDSLTAVSHKDNIIRVISNVLNDVQRSIQGFMQIQNPSLGISFDPLSKALVTDKRIGGLQFYLPQTDHHIFSLDVVRQNYVPPKSDESPLVYTQIDHVAFSDDGSWLATVESRDDEQNAMELRLKFWEYKKNHKRYDPNTCVDLPHDKRIVALKFQPPQKVSSAYLAMTAGEDGKFKIWVLAEEVIKGKSYAWSCQSVGYYGDMPCQDAAFSQDGSLLAVAYDQTITLWTPETNELRKTLTLPYPDEKIRTVTFGANSSSQYLMCITKKYLTVWNLLSCSVWWSMQASVSCLAADPQTDLFAAFVTFDKHESHLYVFDPSSPYPVAVHPAVSKKAKVFCMAFDPTSTVCSSSKDPKIRMSQLYFLTRKQEVFTLDLEETTSTENRTSSQVLVADTSGQQSEFLKIFGQTVSSRDESTSVNRNGKGPRGTPSSAVVNQMIQTPSHVLPSVTSMCLSFLQSFLLSKHTPQSEHQNDEEDSSSEKEAQVMDIDEDDNEVEPMHTAEVTRERLDSSDKDSKRPPITIDNSYLETVDFSWLEEYFK